ncbi:MAG: hypothetical protein RL385_549, partial [Pseudomonadota bacterium]
MATPQNLREELIGEARAWLAWEAELGGVFAPPVIAPPVHHAEAPLPIESTPNLARAGLPRLVELAGQVAHCTRCELAKTRTQTVFARGNPESPLVFVGEGPGQEEDKTGLPFVGAAGQLLDKMLHAMGLNRERGVYIANVIKCRPPHNRNPDPAEVAQCTPYLLRQIELLQPKIVLAMGRFAAQTVLGQGGCMPTDALLQMPLGKLRG